MSSPKVCPHCSLEFSRSTKKDHPDFGKVNHCPHCSQPIFYRKQKSKVIEVVPYKYKYLVDWIIARLNQHWSEISGFAYDLAEATAKERKFAYDLVEFIDKFLVGAYRDVGDDLVSFIKGFMEFILSRDWWRTNLKSLCMLKNKRSSLVHEYYEKQAHAHGVETPYRDEVLKQLAMSFS